MDPTFGTVISQDPDNYGVFVTLDGPFGQSGPPISVLVGTHGPRDAVRGCYPELPLPGQRGVIIFPRKDHRNGVWLCSIPSALNDSNPLVAGAMPAHTELAYGGGLFWRGADGSEHTEYPDGSIMQVGPSQPSLTRHTVDGNQQRQATAFPLSQRVAQAPTAFPFSYTQGGTGASLSLSASGAWVMTAAPGQTITLQVSGGASIVIDGSNVITFTASDHVAVASPNLNATGEVTAKAGSGAFVTLSEHTQNVSGGAGGTAIAPNPGH